MKLNRKMIEKWLKVLDWRHCYLARRAGVPPETLSRWLRRDKPQMPTLEHLTDLRDALNQGFDEKGLPFGVTMDDLLD